MKSKTRKQHQTTNIPPPQTPLETPKTRKGFAKKKRKNLVFISYNILILKYISWTHYESGKEIEVVLIL